MTSLITMWDDIDTSLIPASPEAVAGYVDGKWANYNALVAKYPKAHHLSISVFPADNAECLDVETGDATVADIYDWFKRQQAAKVARPVIYSSTGNMNQIVATMTANGFPRSSYRLWSAHYGDGPHICGPTTCKLTSESCDGTQFTSTAHGESLDESELTADFFGTAQTYTPWKEWLSNGEMSAQQEAERAGVWLSTWLRYQDEHFHGFTPYMAKYINGADLTAKLPKNTRIWSRTPA